ncbi:MAG: hypothetical protein MJZ89_00590 [Paludibacteraceae bacterium]|nr:hypothetical protein [Paludibacteraceae bacterium]
MKTSIHYLALATMFLSLGACSQVQSSRVLLTDESGHKCENVNNISFRKASVTDAIVVNPNEKRQTIEGFGGSLTESSAFVLASIDPAERKAILHELFSEEGANFSMVRTQIGASDFSVEGKYSLAEAENDVELASFTLDRDKEGFSKALYPQVVDEHYDLYHLMKDVYAIKQAQTDQTYRIVANTWTAPAWMKDNHKYYERENGVSRGGALLPEYYQTYADYLVRFLEAYRQEGIECWALTPVNEPMGNDGGWESMDFPPAVEADFIGKYLGPTLHARGFDNVKILGFDQNTFEMGPYTAAIYGDEQANNYTHGMALHWYGSTFSCFPNVLDSIHALYPEKSLLHTEGCIDNLGCPAWPGVTDPVGFTESGWFNNDSFWWNNEATDWAYSTPFWPELHPAYSAVHRYASYIIDGMNHWMTGFIDWNIVLDSIGGPNHVSNFAAAPVMIDYQQGITYFTPYYYALKQFSLSMRPGDVVLGISESNHENLHICAVQKADGSYAINMLNTAKDAITFNLQIGEYVADVTAPANSVQTIFVAL